MELVVIVHAGDMMQEGNVGIVRSGNEVAKQLGILQDVSVWKTR